MDTTLSGEPTFSAKLVLSQEYVDLLLIGKASKPRFSSSFPAKHIETGLGWDDLVLSAEAMHQVQELQNWLQHKKTLMSGLKMDKKLKKGYRVLFHGPPGTGKTLTATLLGKHTKREVYRVDLSMVVSKYIGETEKNLEALFNRAEAKDWILFFDEADALFGKRTGVRDAHDKYANQEVSYLLQRVEDFDGLVILASNMKSNIDEAFIRRFNAIIKFMQPTPDEREKIWKNTFPEKMEFGNNEDVPALVKQYELSGGNIVNVVQYACLTTLAKGKKKFFRRCS
ncbi:ATP-binding protein [Niabella hibiscisoli]|uniref:ATP-binding protein n=1 Tax=Niabella hibiscisoli TaxID=1825928 RepID=UPI001F110E64|nr:ATP-binding protein [Niabella hibiscisoli]MCH5716215.1 ATP-binding protein [Niabella hibiscisoli]